MDSDLRYKLVAMKVDERPKLFRREDADLEGDRVKYHWPLDPDHIIKDFQRLKEKVTQIKGFRPNLDVIVMETDPPFIILYQINFRTLL